MSETQTKAAHEAAPVPGLARRHFLCVALGVAALANALVPALYFSETHLFGHTDARYRALIVLAVLVEYAMVFLVLVLHANVGFASGYALTTATIVTLGSAGLAWLVVGPVGWDRNALYAQIAVLAGLAFAVLSNAVFLLAAIRYTKAVHPRPHLGGFVIGIAASLILLLIYTRVIS
ncbi:MAG TPA: hypothetical protein VMH00_01340 [Candidatus Limnocylindrales bacterium]|nr:hypothetical protein [Candidatus Limnocylindrales bacterium]